MLTIENRNTQNTNEASGRETTLAGYEKYIQNQIYNGKPIPLPEIDPSNITDSATKLAAYIAVCNCSPEAIYAVDKSLFGRDNREAIVLQAMSNLGKKTDNLNNVYGAFLAAKNLEEQYQYPGATNTLVKGLILSGTLAKGIVASMLLPSGDDSKDMPSLQILHHFLSTNENVTSKRYLANQIDEILKVARSERPEDYKVIAENMKDQSNRSGGDFFTSIIETRDQRVAMMDQNPLDYLVPGVSVAASIAGSMSEGVV